MKAIKLAAVAILGATALGVVTPAFADETEVGKTVTNTKVEIIDNDDPANAVLELRTVPTLFSFETTALSGREYTVTSGKPEGVFTVFSDSSDAKWEVRSTMVSNQLELNGVKDQATVTSLKFNGIDLNGTGANGISFKDTETTVKTGDMTKAAKDLEIKFTTNDGVRTLKVDDTLTGTISHQLHNTYEAK